MIRRGEIVRNDRLQTNEGNSVRTTKQEWYTNSHEYILRLGYSRWQQSEPKTNSG